MSKQQKKLDRRQLEKALERGCVAHGLTSGETAAVHLVVAHGRWLVRAELRGHIEIHADVVTGETAWVDWAAVAGECDDAAASTGEVALLRMACHLAGRLPETVHEDWALGFILTSLDPVNAMFASRAAAMAALGPTVVRSVR